LRWLPVRVGLAGQLRWRCSVPVILLFSLVVVWTRYWRQLRRWKSSDGGQTMVVPTDVTDPESVTALFARIKDKLGRLDVLFNNAGTNFPGIPFEDLSYEKWSAVVNVNLTGMFLCAQGAFRLMKEQPRRGAVSSTTVLFPHTHRVLIRRHIRRPNMA
jgi:NAD(P)-dependent dehydrogenase (short-subunit alcohol dehydrogenase family)